jgi:hypothetical protein
VDTANKELPPPATHVVTALYAEHALGLVRLAVIMRGDRAAAEDVVQDAFLGLYRRWDSLPDATHPLAYVRASVLSWVDGDHAVAFQAFDLIGTKSTQESERLLDVAAGSGDLIADSQVIWATLITNDQPMAHRCYQMSPRLTPDGRASSASRARSAPS